MKRLINNYEVPISQNREDSRTEFIRRLKQNLKSYDNNINIGYDIALNNDNKYSIYNIILKVKCKGILIEFHILYPEGNIELVGYDSIDSVEELKIDTNLINELTSVIERSF